MAKFRKEDWVYPIALFLLSVGLFLNEPRSGSGSMRDTAATLEAILGGAILAVIPWGIVKMIVRIMRKPSYPAE